MWLCSRLVALALLCVGVGACNYVNEGVGNNLYTPSTQQQVALQQAYTSVICQQANLYCHDHYPTETEWRIFVLAGMNDIDRRCDEYLSWLYTRKKRKEPVLKQLTDTSKAITAILTATDSKGALPIIAAIFGFASDTFINFHSILLEVNHSTVQALVLGNQNKFRQSLNGVQITSHPYAMYILRNYLRLCLPFTIETQINNNIVIFEQGGPGAIERLQTDPMVRPIATPLPSEPPPVTPPPLRTILGAIGNLEEAISLGSGEAFQRTLCVSATGNFGPEGSTTRAALGQFYSAQYYPDTVAVSIISSDDQLRRLRGAQRTFPSCPAAGFRNAFEVGIFSRPDVSGTVDPMRPIAQVRQALVVAGLTIPSGLQETSFGPTMMAGLREAIPSLRQHFGVQGEPTLDLTLYDRIVRSGAR
jgi:hypothetical protein